MIISRINRIITNGDTRAVFSRRFVDKASFCLVNMKDKTVSYFNLENADYVSPVKMSNDHFLCVHYFKGEKIVLTIHSFIDPTVKLSRLEIKYESVSFDGDLDLWRQAPRFFEGALKDNQNAWKDSIVEIDPVEQKVHFHSLDWYQPGDDMMGMVEVIEVPDTNSLLFPINKTSSFILYDIAKEKLVRWVTATTGRGVSSFQFRKQQSELWTLGYDTLFRLQVGSWKIIQKRRVSGTFFSLNYAAAFAFTPDERHCVVTCPNSNEILLLDAENMKEVDRVKSKHCPQEVAVFNNFECVYLDQKSEDVNFQLLSLKRS